MTSSSQSPIDRVFWTLANSSGKMERSTLRRRRGSSHPDTGWRSLAGSAPSGRHRGRAELPEGGCFSGAWHLKSKWAEGVGARSLRRADVLLASRKSLYKPNSSFRSSQDMPPFRVSSASLSSSLVSAASNSICSIGASWRVASSEGLTMIFSQHFQA